MITYRSDRPDTTTWTRLRCLQCGDVRWLPYPAEIVIASPSGGSPSIEARSIHPWSHPCPSTAMGFATTAISLVVRSFNQAGELIDFAAPWMEQGGQSAWLLHKDRDGVYYARKDVGKS